MNGTRRRTLDDFRAFFSEVRRNFATVGAIAPSSPHLARAIVHPLRQRPSRPISVLEVGPGTGSFTRRILENLRAGDAFDIFELNPKFCHYLHQSMAKADIAAEGIQFEIHNADIRSLKKPIQYDYIISGLPFNNFDSQTVTEILEVLMDHLSATGVFSYFEYLLPQGVRARFLKREQRERLRGVSKTVRKFNQQHQYSCDHVWWNLPPAAARHCRKPV